MDNPYDLLDQPVSGVKPPTAENPYDALDQASQPAPANPYDTLDVPARNPYDELDQAPVRPINILYPDFPGGREQMQEANRRFSEPVAEGVTGLYPFAKPLSEGKYLDAAKRFAGNIVSGGLAAPLIEPASTYAANVARGGVADVAAVEDKYLGNTPGKGGPSYTGNLKAALTGKPLPIDEALSTAGEDGGSTEAVIGKVSQGISGAVPLIALTGRLPAEAQVQIGRAFVADMLVNNTATAKELYDEFQKPPEQRDQQKINDLVAQGIQDTGFLALAGVGAMRGRGDVPDSGTASAEPIEQKVTKETKAESTALNIPQNIPSKPMATVGDAIGTKLDEIKALLQGGGNGVESPELNVEGQTNAGGAPAGTGEAPVLPEKTRTITDDFTDELRRNAAAPDLEQKVTEPTKVYDSSPLATAPEPKPSEVVGNNDSKNLPDWAKEEMQRRGQDPARPFNDIDIANPSVRTAIESDPTLTSDQKTSLLEKGQMPTADVTGSSAPEPDRIEDALNRAIEATKFDPTKLQEGITGAPVWITKAAANGALRVVKAVYLATKNMGHALQAGLTHLRESELKGYNEDEARAWISSFARELDGTAKPPEDGIEQKGTKETNVVENTDEPAQASTDTGVKPEWQTLREKVDAASDKLRQAIHEHGTPAKFGKTKTQTLAAKNLAGAEYRNLRADLYEHRGYVEALLKEQDRLLDSLLEAPVSARSDIEFKLEDIKAELGNVDPRLLNNVFEKTFPQKVDKRSRSEIAADRSLEHVTLEERRKAEAPTPDLDEADSLPEGKAARMFTELPGRVREVFERGKSMQDNLRRVINTRDNRDTISYTKDAAETIGARIGKQAGNIVRHELNRAFGESDINTRNDVREWALTPVVESGMDRATLAEHRRGVEESDNRNSVAAKRWLAAAKYAEKHWDRLQPVAEIYKQITDTENAVENEAGIPTLHRENYVFHVQDVSPKWANTELSGGGSGPSAPFKHIRDHATYAEAIASGVKPQSLNAVDLLEHRISLGRKLVGYRAWIESMGHIIDPVSEKPVVTAPTVRKRQDGSQDVTAPPGYHIEQFAGQQFAVHSGYSGLFSALTGESGLKGAGWQAYLKTAQTSKHLLLLVDTYHLGRLAYFSAMARGAGEGMRSWLPGVPGFKRGLSILDNTASDLRAMAERGDIPKEWLNGVVEDRRLLDGLLQRGLNVGHVVDNLYADWIRDLPVFGDINRFIFDKFQRGTMAETALIELKRQIKANPGIAEDAVMRQVAKQVNTRFGNLGSQGVIKSKTANDLARLVFLAPQWNASLITSEIKAYKQLGYDLPKAVVQGKAPNVQLLGRAAAAAVLTQLAANQIINYMTRGHSTFENKEEGIGAKLSAWIPDVVGNSAGYFLNPMTLPTEMTSYAVKSIERTGDITKTGKEFLSSRLHTGSRAIMTGFTREDETGAKLRGGNEVAAQMAMSLVPLPLSTSALVRAGKQVVTGKPEEQFPGQYEKQVAQTFGLKLDMAPTAEQRIRSLATAFNKDNKVVPNADFFHGPYYFIDRAAVIGNQRNLDTELEKTLETKTPADVYKHYKQWIGAPFTGNRGREGEFYKSLTEEQKTAYDKARTERGKLAQSILEEIPRVVAKKQVGSVSE